jgi:hypothetical protein
MSIIKFLMATSYVTNDIQSNNPTKCYITSSIYPLGIFFIYFDSLITFTYPLFNNTYNHLFNIWHFIALQPFLIMIFPFFIRLLITHNDLIKYIESHDKKKFRLYGNIIFCSYMLSIGLAVLFFYLVYVKG